MLLTIDIGNTNIKFGLFEKENKISFEMIESKPSEFKSIVLSFLYKANIRENQIENSIISSVVPSLCEQIISVIKEITNKEPIIINNNNYYGIKIDKNISDEVGSDLLVACAYAYQKHQKELLLLSLGTATVLAHISDDGTFKGCLIAPGFNAMANSIYSKAEQLPEFSPTKNTKFLANNTIDAMNIGLFEGYLGMVKSLIHGVQKELNSFPPIIGCGGVGKDVAKYIDNLYSYDADLVSIGLNYIYNRYIK